MGVIIESCRKGLFQAVSTQVILQESEFNIAKKLSKRTLIRFYKNIATIHLLLEPNPTEEEIKNCTKYIHPKDAHVLAAALKSKSDYLLTLDRKHFQTEKIKLANLGIEIVTPGEFLKAILK